MINKIVCQFSSYNKRTHVPKILKDPKFSRRGIVKKKSQVVKEHDISGGYVSRGHLFYSERQHQTEEETYQIARQAIRDEKVTGFRQEEQLLFQLVDNKSDSLNSLLKLHNYHREYVNQHLGEVRQAIREIGVKMYERDLEEIKQVVGLMAEYNQED